MTVFVLTPGYRRSIAVSQAVRFRRQLDAEIPAVGVFVDTPREEIVSLLKEGTIQMVQLHGTETEEDIRAIKSVTDRPVMKAVRVKNRQDVENWMNSEADYLVFDAGTGSGQTFDWRFLENVRRKYFLAGGLNANNLRDALEKTHPFAVDLSSGVETDGVKDEQKMKEVVKLVRNVELPDSVITS